MPKEAKINITIRLNEDGTSNGITMESTCSTRDRIMAAMYLLEDAVRSEPIVDGNENPVASMCAAGFNAAIVMANLMKAANNDKND